MIEWLTLTNIALVASMIVSVVSLGYSLISLLHVRRRREESFAVSVSPEDGTLRMLANADPEIQEQLSKNPGRVVIHFLQVGPNESAVLHFGEEADAKQIVIDLGERKDITPIFRILRARGELDEGEWSWQTRKPNQRKRPKVSRVEIQDLPFQSGDALHAGEKVMTIKT